MKVRIENIGEGICKIDKEVTEEQYYFLKDLFKELNETYDRECYSPNLTIKVIYESKNTSNH